MECAELASHSPGTRGDGVCKFLHLLGVQSWFFV